MPEMYGPPAPQKKKKTAREPKILALSSGDYLQNNPWAQIDINKALQPVDFAAMQPTPPKQIAATRIAEDITQEPSPYPVQTQMGPIQPTLGWQNVRSKPISGDNLQHETSSKLSSGTEENLSKIEDIRMHPSEYGKLIAGISRLPEVRARKIASDEYQNVASKAISGMPSNVDISPLLAWYDSMYKTNLLGGYEKPMSYMDKAKMILGAAKQNVEGEEGYLSDLNKMAEFLKTGRTQESQKQDLIEALGEGFSRFKPPAPPSARSQMGRDPWRITKEGGKVFSDYTGVKSQLDALNSALAKGTTASVSRALSLAARALSDEKGVLTNPDIDRQLPPTIERTFSGIVAYLTNNPDVKLSPELLRGIRAEVADASARIRARYKNRFEAMKQSMASNPELSAHTTLIDPYLSAINKDMQPDIDKQNKTNGFLNKMEALLQKNLQEAKGGAKK